MYQVHKTMVSGVCDNPQDVKFSDRSYESLKRDSVEATRQAVIETVKREWGSQPRIKHRITDDGIFVYQVWDAGSKYGEKPNPSTVIYRISEMQVAKS